MRPTTHRLSTLDKLIKKFPNGKYWNHEKDMPNNPDGWTESPCNHDLNGTKYCNEFLNAWQCLGFALKCGYDATGTNPRDWPEYTNPDSLYDLKAGDILTYRNESGGSHTVYVTRVFTGLFFNYGDCNGDGPNYQCIIRWNKTKNFEVAQYNFINLRSAPEKLENF